MTALDLSEAKWRKSSRSDGQSNCVEITDNLASAIAVRDSKDPSGPASTVAPSARGSFVEEPRLGSLDA